MKTNVHNTDGWSFIFFLIKTMLMKINIVIIVYLFLKYGLNFIQESHWAFKNISTKMLNSREKNENFNIDLISIWKKPHIPRSKLLLNRNIISNIALYSEKSICIVKSINVRTILQPETLTVINSQWIWFFRSIKDGYM